nr:hypothetical protein [Candidatus Freyarchaeota archaeon]
MPKKKNDSVRVPVQIPKEEYKEMEKLRDEVGIPVAQQIKLLLHGYRIVKAEEALKKDLKESKS